MLQAISRRCAIVRCVLAFGGCAAVLCAAHSSIASAAIIEVIYTDLATHPTAQVPGLPAGTIFQSFDRPFRSPDGSRWIISADTDLATAEDEVIIVGSGTSGSVVVREGTPATLGGPPGENIGVLDTSLSINDAGQFVFATNSSGPTTADEYIVRWDGSAFEASAKEGQPIPFLAGASWGTTLDSPLILNDGTVGFAADVIVGVPTSQDDMLVLGSTILAQKGVTIPSGQTGTSEAWENFDASDFFTDASGANWIALGDLLGSTAIDDVAVVNNAVVLQEGVVIPGSGFANPVDANGIAQVYMSSAGDWMARGNNDITEQDWIVRNGTVIARTGDPVMPGSTELFSDDITADCFFSMVGNNLGDYVIGGRTNNADILADSVLVLNAGSEGASVVARRSDPIDLDGNGLPDDDAFINAFNNDDAFLTNDGWYYFTADLRNEKGDGIGQAFLRLQVQTPDVPGDANGDGVVDVDDLIAAILAWGACADCPPASCPADFDDDCDVDVDDLNTVILNWG